MLVKIVGIIVFPPAAHVIACHVRPWQRTGCMGYHVDRLLQWAYYLNSQMQMHILGVGLYVVSSVKKRAAQK